MKTETETEVHCSKPVLEYRRRDKTRGRGSYIGDLLCLTVVYYCHILGNLVTEISRFVGLSLRDTESNMKKTQKKIVLSTTRLGTPETGKEEAHIAGTKNNLS